MKNDVDVACGGIAGLVEVVQEKLMKRYSTRRTVKRKQVRA
jgi:hypothetical protein